MKSMKFCEMEVISSHNINGSSSSFLHSSKAKEGKDKLAWLRSQLIGEDVKLEAPFGNRRLTYADHTATGRSLLSLENYITKHVLPFYGNTHTSDSFVGQRTTRMVMEATAYVKKCIRAGPETAVIFCGSGATAAIKRLQEVMGIVIPSHLKGRENAALTEEERWVVFLGPWEHHSNLLSWRQTAADVVEIGVDGRTGLLDMEQLEVELDRTKCANRRMLGSFSACSNVTGILCDTRALARLLHQYGAFACFDFATSGPYVEIDMGSEDSERYDAVFLSPHKFVGGPGSPGILVMNKALYQHRSLPPSTCGGGVVAYVNGFNPNDTLYYDDIEEREEAGTPPIIQKIRTALAFRVKEFIGYDVIDRCETFFIEAAFKRFLPNPNIHILGNLEVKRLAILSFLIFPADNGESKEESANGKKTTEKPLNGRFVAKLLNDLFGIQARGGCSCAGPYGHYLLGIDESFSLGIRSLIQKGYKGLKPGWTRVSFSYYMTMEEFQFILSAIDFIAANGHRFLSLYDFDWKTGDWKYGMPLMPNYLIGMKKGKLKALYFQSRKRSVSRKFAKYLKRAVKIVASLPEKPCAKKVPEEVDYNLIYFKI
ncbi:hypothetical protein IEQ34_027082 [Dendrobium chrysotoxum]|uniref:Aminotransferase class V domain-containing protein n=1 Tax=Dendrobium chrysotoxum TaxID=161865 RepID=A0AAV7FG60_DENCH|nr:hypothetical protein IEQ34_027082 [Dendrobium chrysotoxum]